MTVTLAAHSALQELREELRRHGTEALGLKDNTISEIVLEGVRLVRRRAFPDKKAGARS